MEWTQVIVILGVFVGVFLYLANRIDAVRNDLAKEIQKNREEILWIKFRLDPNEHHHHRKEEKKEEN